MFTVNLGRPENSYEISDKSSFITFNWKNCLNRIPQNWPRGRGAASHAGLFSFCPLTSDHLKSPGPSEARGHFNAQLCFRFMLLSCSLFAWTVGSVCEMRNKTVHYLLISRWTGARQPSFIFHSDTQDGEQQSGH